MTLAADVYRPKGARGALAALAVCGPFGAVKEQSSGIYAQAMAERGYLAVAVDPAFTGESGAVRATSRARTSRLRTTARTRTTSSTATTRSRA